jgi:hypothetical protein
MLGRFDDLSVVSLQNRKMIDFFPSKQINDQGLRRAGECVGGIRDKAQTSKIVAVWAAAAWRSAAADWSL